MPSSKPTPVLFADLVGTLIYNGVRDNFEKPVSFISDPTEVEVFPGVVDLLKAYKAKGWRIVVVSNQGGVAMGKLAESTVNRIMAESVRLCANLLDRIIWCPHFPKAEGKTEEDTLELSVCWCRKPRVGMVMATVASLGDQYPNEFYRPYASLFVGDREEDRLCAENANIKFMWASDWRKLNPSGV